MFILIENCTLDFIMKWLISAMIRTLVIEKTKIKILSVQKYYGTEIRIWTVHFLYRLRDSD